MDPEKSVAPIIGRLLAGSRGRSNRLMQMMTHFVIKSLSNFVVTKKLKTQ
jgi:hypothetical protein